MLRIAVNNVFDNSIDRFVLYRRAVAEEAAPAPDVVRTAHTADERREVLSFVGDEHDIASRLRGEDVQTAGEALERTVLEPARYASVEYGDVREGCHERERVLEYSSAPPLAHDRAEVATAGDEVGCMKFLVDEDAIRRIQSTPIIDDEPLRRKPSRRRQDHCGKARERGIFGIVDICEKQFLVRLC